MDLKGRLALPIIIVLLVIGVLAMKGVTVRTPPIVKATGKVAAKVITKGRK